MRECIVAEARLWIDTPFVHQGRVLGVGVDCAGLIICVGNALQLLDYDETGYPPKPDGVSLQRSCDAQLIRIDDYRLGDVVLFRFGAEPQHLAIVGDYAFGGFSIIHAYAPNKRVIETTFDAIWKRRIVQAYRYPGVE